MTTIDTVRFGQIEFEDDNVFTFVQGMPGFESNLQFLLLQAPDNVPFYFLQAVDDQELAFVLTDPFYFYPEYAFDLSDAVSKELEISNPADVKVWSVVTLNSNEGLNAATINLLAPIILNKNTRRAKQIVLIESTYSTKHVLIQAEFREQEKENKENVGVDA